MESRDQLGVCQGNVCLSETCGASFWAQQQTKNLGSRCQYPTPRALSLCISHPDGAGEAGEGRTKAQKDCLVSFLTLPACYTLCQVIFTPSKFEAACCAVKNPIKLNYSAARSFPPPHLSSFLHLIPEQRKITQQSIRKGETMKAPQQVWWMAQHLSIAWGAQAPCQVPAFPPAHLPGAVPLWPQCQGFLTEQSAVA